MLTVRFGSIMAGGILYQGFTRLQRGRYSGKSYTDEECEKRVCRETQDMLRDAFRQPFPITPATKKPIPCPPDRATLGRHSWTLIHSMSAHYPDEPSKTRHLIR